MLLSTGLIKPPLTGRNSKPRADGLTMVIDKGLPLEATDSWLKLNADFIDYIKLAFGTMMLYPQEILTAKIRLSQKYQIPIYPGGTFLEIALWEQKFDTCLENLKQLGFEWLEISDGTLTISPSERQNLIAKAIQAGFQVITEVGKKDTANQPHIAAIARLVLDDLAAGAKKVIIEARESGTGIGIYDQEGGIITEKVEVLREALPIDKIIWEAPLKKQQVELIKLFGPNVNLGNLAPTEVMALEALRRGLRNDTWKPLLKS